MISESPSISGNVQSISGAGFSWTNVERPSRADLDDIARSWDVGSADLALALDGSQTWGTFRREHYLMIRVQIPLPSPSRQHQTPLTSPVVVFVRPDSLLTIHSGQFRGLNRLFQRLSSDAAAREAGFAEGVGGVLFSIVQRLVETLASERTRIDHGISLQEGDIPRAAGASFIAAIVDRQRDVRVLRQAVAPLPGVIRGLAEIDLGLIAREDWEHLARRVDHLLADLDGAADALRSLIAVAEVATNQRRTEYVRALVVVVAVALPVLTTTTLLVLIVGSPISGQSNGLLAAVLIVAAVLLGTLLVLKRGRVL